MLRRLSQRGISGIEVSICLILIAALLAGTFVGVSALNDSRKTNQTISDMNEVLTAGRSISSMRQPGEAIDVRSELGASGLLPRAMISPSGDVINPFGGTFLIEPETGTCSGCGGALRYITHSIPEDVCFRIAMADFSVPVVQVKVASGGSETLIAASDSIPQVQAKCKALSGSKTDIILTVNTY